VLVSRRAGALTAWGNAYLLGSASLDEAAAAVVGDDVLHRVLGVPGEADPVTLAVALGRLRASGVRGLRLVLPEPGDLVGMPGPAALSADAALRGAAVLTVGDLDVTPWALLPTVGASVDALRWDVVRADWSVPPHGLPTLSEADRALSEALRDTTHVLDALEVARGRDDVAARLTAIDTDLRRIDLPSSLPARAQRMVVTATRLLSVASIAAESDGAAVTASVATRRREALRTLRTTARYALCAAYSAALEPATR
jgi:hypothetical protein